MDPLVAADFVERLISSAINNDLTTIMEKVEHYVKNISTPTYQTAWDLDGARKLGTPDARGAWVMEGALEKAQVFVRIGQVAAKVIFGIGNIRLRRLRHTSP